MKKDLRKDFDYIASCQMDSILEGMDYGEKDYYIFNTEQVEYAVSDMVDKEATKLTNSEVKENIELDIYLSEEEMKKDREDIYQRYYNERLSLYSVVLLKRIEKLAKEEGLEIYDGDFFPCNGNFKSLSAEQIAFVR